MSKRNDEAFINKEFVDRVDWVIDDTLLHDETFKTWEHTESEARKAHEREMDLSELRRIVENFTKSDFAAVVITAMDNYPYMVLQIVAEHIQHLEEGERR